MIETTNQPIRTRKGYDKFPRFAIKDARTGKAMRFEQTDVIRGSILDVDEVRLAGIASDANPPTAAIVNYDGGIVEARLTRAAVAAVTTAKNARWLELFVLREGEVHPLGVAPLDLGPDITA